MATNLSNAKTLQFSISQLVLSMFILCLCKPQPGSWANPADRADEERELQAMHRNAVERGRKRDSIWRGRWGEESDMDWFVSCLFALRPVGSGAQSMRTTRNYIVCIEFESNV